MNDAEIKLLHNLIDNKEFKDLQIIRSLVNLEWTKREEELCDSISNGDIVEFTRDIYSHDEKIGNRKHIGVVINVINKSIKVLDKDKNEWALESSEITQRISTDTS